MRSVQFDGKTWDEFGKKGKLQANLFCKHKVLNKYYQVGLRKYKRNHNSNLIGIVFRIISQNYVFIGKSV